MTDVLEPYQEVELKPGDRVIIRRFPKEDPTHKTKEMVVSAEILRTSGGNRVRVIESATVNDTWIYHQYRGLLRRIIHLTGQDDDTGVWAFNELERISRVLGLDFTDDQKRKTP